MPHDFGALLFDPVYAELGVPAVFSVNGEIVDLTVIDDTRRETNVFGTAPAEIYSVGPAAFARIPELTARGIARDDYIDATLAFNGRSWIVHAFELRGSPNGEDQGEVRFLLKETDG